MFKSKVNPLMRLQSLFVFLLVVLFSCQDEDDVAPDLAIPTIENVEIGLNNNEIGVVGRDFHFNADVVAGDRIENIQIKIMQREDETYAQAWSHEVTWDQYIDARNTNVHRHFNIPEDAVEGKYDFLIIVNDQNGTKLEELRAITIYEAENLPVDPQLSGFAVIEVDEDFNQLRRIYNILLPESGDRQASEGQIISTFGNVSGVKGDGKMYFVIINKKHNHRPETIEALDFSKVIVSDYWEHKDIAETRVLSTLSDHSTSSTRQPTFVIGTEMDNNIPANAVSGEKSWETGDYYIGAIYHNDTYNIGLFQYIEVSITME
ncbi:DUF4625 domain-containing protein [Belliella sp. DSM 111904]|uniref:DUF4625 domain-containing protein n=1 Tax=Belliella filtrata TaxID=2923435 RepID=A0ABS9UZB0_9BACT|nr:DUF4625 domain-containing protein [Belliella filtrata]MCH7409497.1 DUF4625 domain-containing protein [Belliella filtrata]